MAREISINPNCIFTMWDFEYAFADQKPVQVAHQDLRYHNFKISQVVKIITPHKMHISRCAGYKVCVKRQREPLKFHTKFGAHTQQNIHFTEFYLCVIFNIFELWRHTPYILLVRRSPDKTIQNDWWYLTKCHCTWRVALIDQDFRHIVISGTVQSKYSSRVIFTSEAWCTITVIPSLNCFYCHPVPLASPVGNLRMWNRQCRHPVTARGLIDMPY